MLEHIVADLEKARRGLDSLIADRAPALHIKVIHNLIELVERHFAVKNYMIANINTATVL